MALISGLLGGMSGVGGAIERIGMEQRRALAEKARMELQALIQQGQQERDQSFREREATTKHERAVELGAGQQLSTFTDDKGNVRVVDLRKSGHGGVLGKAPTQPEKGTWKQDEQGTWHHLTPGDSGRVKGPLPKDKEKDDALNVPAATFDKIYDSALKEVRSELKPGLWGRMKGEKPPTEKEIQAEATRRAHERIRVLSHGGSNTQPPGQQPPQSQDDQDYAELRNYLGGGSDLAGARPGPTSEAAPQQRGPSVPLYGGLVNVSTPKPSQQTAQEPEAGLLPSAPQETPQRGRFQRVTPEQHQAAMDEVRNAIDKVGLGPDNWKALWSMLSQGAKAVWGGYSEFVNSVASELQEGQREARQNLGRSR